MTTKYNFEGRRILVTGAGAGIGRAICKALHGSGAKVYGVSKTHCNLLSLQAECPGMEIVSVDLSNWELTHSCLSPLPTMHAVVNNAGTGVLASFLDSTPEDFDRLFSSNVKQVLNVSQIFAKKMIKDNIKGNIVNMSSQASQAALKEHTLYCGTKGALDMITKVGALELGEQGIRVNCVNPTVVMTEMGRMAWSDPSKADPMLAKIPLGRFAEVEDVVKTTLFLLSDDAAMINGATLPVDGGFLAT